MKWLWRYNGEDQTFWREVIQCKYGQTNHTCTNIVSNNYGVGVWRSVRASWPTLSENICYKVGNGRGILFLERWLEWSGTIDGFLSCLILCMPLDEYRTPQVWDITFRRYLNDWVGRVVASWNFFRTWHNQVKRRKMDPYQLKGPTKGN